MLCDLLDLVVSVIVGANGVVNDGLGYVDTGSQRDFCHFVAAFADSHHSVHSGGTSVRDGVSSLSQIVLLSGFVHVAANDLAAFEKAVAEYPVAAILLEVVQGEGGVNTLDADYLKSVDAICKEKDILLMVDEVQTGNGRTGKLYGYMHFDITPDVVSTAKGLGGGLPIGATLLSDKVKDVLGYSEHGSTFGGNPIAAAGAVSIIDRLDDSFLAEVEEKGNYLREVFSSAEGVKSVSGLGLMVGIETVKPAGEVLAACMEKGVLCLTAKTKLRLLPALNIPMALLKEAVEVILAACK